MKKFNFRLDRIRKFKQQLEQDKKRGLAVEQIRCQAEKQKLSAITSTHKKYLSSYGVRQPGRVNVRELIISRRYIDKLSGDMEKQTGTVTAVEKDVAGAQKALLEASREKKKYEKLKERKLQAYLEESRFLENKELDEFGSRSARIKSDSVQRL